MHISRLITTLITLVTANASIAGNFSAQPQPASSSHNLMDLSIEELMNIEVTTASRQAQKLSQTSSAVFVITQEDIRRSGATSIPDALRMAPGVEVSRINADKWS
ncbi:MAG TPA: TonB-dependent receptor plug domain-containing protein, partial [Nitrosomonas sp.]|nr:TonB-dependent receptor plug domain-containing protein [Nitrosomonas sp.]